MKKYLFLMSFVLLALSCSKDSDSDNATTDGDLRMENSAITNIYATGSVAEQTPEQAKETIFGKWDLGSSNSSAKSALKNGCSFESLEFTDDSYLIGISDPNGESINIYGTYGFEEENDKVVSVQLNTFMEGESVMVAEITDIVVVENNGVIDIAFTFTFLVDLINYDIPCSEDLNQDYSAEKEEPMEGTLEADENSNHYKAVGKYIATAYSDSDGWDLDRFLNDSCIGYDYNFETGEEIEFTIEDCTPPDTVQLELSTFGTYLFMDLYQNTPLYIEQGTWAFNEDGNSITVGGPDNYFFVVDITELSESGMTMSITEEEDGYEYSASWVWTKQ